jgi:predicted DNA-binding transcriptional regulator AlpA
MTDTHSFQFSLDNGKNDQYNAVTMKLETYMKFNGITVREAANQLGRTPAWIYEIVSGRKTPGSKLARKIVDWSEGEVRFEDLWRR